MEAGKKTASPPRAFTRPAPRNTARLFRAHLGIGLLKAAFFLVLSAFAFTAANAGDFQPDLTQYGHTSWRVQDGALKGTVNGIAQTSNGYLWVGTNAGLERFDGTQFRYQTFPTELSVMSLLGANDGSLWIATQAGLFHLHDGHTEAIKNLTGSVDALIQDSAGDIWLARSRTMDSKGPLCRIRNNSVRCYGKSAGIACRYADSIAEDRPGDFLIGSDSGICRWNSLGGSLMAPQDTSLLNLQGVSALISRRDGSTLAGFVRPGDHLGLQVLSGNTWSAFKCEGLDGSKLSVSTLLIDRQGGLWVGTINEGIFHVADGESDHFSSTDGLSSDTVEDLFEDREGDVWAGTTGGLDRFHKLSVTSFSMREGLSSAQVSAVLATHDGALWIGTSTGLDVLRNGRIVHINKAVGLPGQAVTSLLEDHSGQLWVGVDNDLTRYNGARFKVFRKPDGTPVGAVREMAEDAGHNIWALSAGGRPNRLYEIRNGQIVTEHISPPTPQSIATGPDGAMWIESPQSVVRLWDDKPSEAIPSGISKRFSEMMIEGNGAILGADREGLHHEQNGKWSLLNGSNGLPCNDVQSFVFDNLGSLWLQMQCGMAIINARSLESHWTNSASHLSIKILDNTDGARPGAASFAPASTKSPDGRLWFATDGVLLSVDPAHLEFNSHPPPVHIERIVADHVEYALEPSLVLPPLTRDVEIDYAGLSFVAPQKVQYQYRLIGSDSEWQSVGTRNAAFYMNLSPGHYLFQVTASNNNDVWSPSGDILRFTIRPAIYQTTLFKIGVAVLGITLLWLLIRARVRFATAQAEARLSERQAERVRIAREIHDTLLQGFHGLIARFQVVANAAPEPTRRMIEEVLDRADALLIESRDRVRDLRSAEEGGSPLGDELWRAAFEIERDGSVPIELKLSGDPVPLNVDVQREVLAIAKEAMMNASKHANASYIVCESKFTRSYLMFACEDDGTGIDPEILRAGGKAGHWGLSGMRERARQIGSKLTIRSVRHSGTRIELNVDARIAYAARRPGSAIVGRRIGSWLWPTA